MTLDRARDVFATKVSVALLPLSGTIRFKDLLLSLRSSLFHRVSVALSNIRGDIDVDRALEPRPVSQNSAAFVSDSATISAQK